MTRRENTRSILSLSTGKSNHKTLAAKRFSYLVLFLRNSESKPVSQEGVVLLRKSLPQLADSSELPQLTQAEFVKRLLLASGDGEDLTTGTLQRWEDAQVLPEIINVLRVCIYANLKVEDVLVYMFPGMKIGQNTESKETTILSETLKQVRILEIPDLYEVMDACLRSVRGRHDTGSKTENEVIHTPVSLTQKQLTRLNSLLKTSWEKSPELKERGGAIEQNTLHRLETADTGFGWTIDLVEQIAACCCRVKVWDNSDGVWCDCESTYEGYLRELLEDLEVKPTVDL